MAETVRDTPEHKEPFCVDQGLDHQTGGPGGWTRA